MRVLLALPPYDFRDFYPEYMARKTKVAEGKGFGLIPGATAPLGLLYIAAVLRDSGHDVTFMDGVFSSEGQMLGFIKREEIELLGCMMMGYGWFGSQEFLRRVKEVRPETTIVVGGPWPDVRQSECLEQNEAVDFAVAGDGEYILRDLIRCLEEGGDPTSVPGLAWREGGEIRRSPPAPLIEDLDGVPFPARELIDTRRYSPAIGHYLRQPCSTMIGQRGCGHRCIFCHTNTPMRTYERYRSPNNVVDEMEELEHRYGTRDILFWDNNLTENLKNISERCEEKLRRGLKVIWSGNTRCDTLDEETAKLMHRAGCWKLLIGIESGVQRNLDTLQKNETVEGIERGVRICQKVGIRVFATFIFGIPGETYEDGLESIEFAKKLNADYVKFFTLGPIRGPSSSRAWPSMVVFTWRRTASPI